MSKNQTLETSNNNHGTNGNGNGSKPVIETNTNGHSPVVNHSGSTVPVTSEKSLDESLDNLQKTLPELQQAAQGLLETIRRARAATEEKAVGD